MMEINANKPVGNQVQGPERTKSVGEVRREKENAPDRQTAQSESGPNDRVSISDRSPDAISEPKGARVAGQGAQEAGLSEEQAARLAQQTSEQLAQTGASISNNAIQKAVDLFT